LIAFVPRRALENIEILSEKKKRRMLKIIGILGYMTRHEFTFEGMLLLTNAKVINNNVT